jgi:transposase
MEHYKINSTYYCGVDLHAHNMYVCVMNKDGDILLHKNMRTESQQIKRNLAPFMPDICIGVESTYNYYWLADACRFNKIPFYLGHAYYMKSIHGGKKKNDKIDSKKIADLMRSNHLPKAYSYPHERRATRDLLRRRHRYGHIRSEAYTHIQCTFHQHEKYISPSAVRNKCERHLLVDAFDDPILKTMLEADLETIYFLDPKIKQLENIIRKQAKDYDRDYHTLLQSVPGLGDILSLIVLYEIDDINRFPSAQRFCSYARLVRGSYESAGKRLGQGKIKIGNPWLKYAIADIIIHAERTSPYIAQFYQRLQKQYGLKRAKSIISHKFGVAIYYMLKNKQVFDEKRFAQSSMK